MTETEWLSATDPTPFLEFLRCNASDRKLRLLACAFCRRRWVLLPIGVKEAVQTIERFVDGQVTNAEFSAQVFRQAWYARRLLPWRGLGYTHGSTEYGSHVEAIEEVAKAFIDEPQEGWHKNVQTALLRDIFGNPFRPVVINPSWLTSTVQALASGIYSDRAFDRMPIFADALQDAGCDNDDVLNHCRQAGDHCRGCWVVDLLLAKG
jgi:hypothetical protein